MCNCAQVRWVRVTPKFSVLRPLTVYLGSLFTMARIPVNFTDGNFRIEFFLLLSCFRFVLICTVSPHIPGLLYHRRPLSLLSNCDEETIVSASVSRQTRGQYSFMTFSHATLLMAGSQVNPAPMHARGSLRCTSGGPGRRGSCFRRSC